MSKHRRQPRAAPPRPQRHRGRRRSTRRGFKHGPALALAGFLTAGLVAVPVVALAGREERTKQPGQVETALESPASSSASRPPRAVEAVPGEANRKVPTRPERRAETIPESGPGTFMVAPASTADAENATTYRVEVERGLPFAATEVGRFVEQTLSDKRGWSGAAGHRLVRVEHEADLRIVLATPGTADALCAPLDTEGRLSCRNGANVVINAWRWANGAKGYQDALIAYRRYVVNHETGHALGYPHTPCPGTGQQAPVMLQQTLGLDGCRPNPWPNEHDLAADSH